MRTILTALESHLKSDTTLNNSVRGNIFSDDALEFTDFPAIVFYPSSGDHTKFFGGTAWEVIQIQFGIITPADRTGSLSLTGTIEGYLYSFLKSNPTFAATGYAKIEIFMLKPSLPRIVTIDGKRYSLDSPIYRVQGWKNV